MGRSWLPATGPGGVFAVLGAGFSAVAGKAGLARLQRQAPAITVEALAARAARDFPDFLTGGPVLRAADGALVALERSGQRLAVLLPRRARLVLRVVPAKSARVEWAQPPVLAVETGDWFYPWVRAVLPEGPQGTAFLLLLGGRF